MARKLLSLSHLSLSLARSRALHPPVPPRARVARGARSRPYTLDPNLSYSTLLRRRAIKFRPVFDANLEGGGLENGLQAHSHFWGYNPV